MKRGKLKKLAREIASELGHQPLAYWRSLKLPHTYSEQRDGGELTIELTLLEEEPDYLHIAVALDDGGWLRNILPVSSSFIVRVHEGVSEGEVLR